MSAIYDCCVHCDHDPDPAFWHGDPCEDDRCPASQPLDLTVPPKLEAPVSDTCGHCYHNKDGAWVCCLCQPEAVA